MKRNDEADAFDETERRSGPFRALIYLAPPLWIYTCPSKKKGSSCDYSKRTRERSSNHGRPKGKGHSTLDFGVPTLGDI